MDSFKQFFQNFGTNARNFWNSMSVAKKAAFGGTVLLIIGLIGALAASSKKTEYEYLFKNLSNEDVDQITAILKQQGTEYMIVDKEGIKVPTKDVAMLRLKLAQEGLPNHGVVGWEKFDAQEFTRTEFEQRINKQRAIQGELSRTIMMIPGVINAKVHIVTPKKSLFLEDKLDPTAAVYIKTRPNMQLDKKQIKGIQTIVSRSVEGLKPNNVTIVDNDGKMLTEVESEDFASKMTKEMTAYKRGVEKQYEENIRGLVGRIVGPDKVEVKVDAVVDFTQESQTISDVDPDRVAPIAKETTGMSLSGTGLNPTGIPGSKSNVPGEQEELSINQSNTQNKKDSERINFEISKTVSQKTLPVGKITKLSAAVIVDGKQEYHVDGSRPVFEPRTQDELKTIEELVKSALGFDDKRGDNITVRNMMFQLDPVQMDALKEEKKETREYISTLAMSSAVALALTLFFAFIVRPYFRWLSYDPNRKYEQQMVEDYKPDLEIGALQNVQIKEDVPFEKLSPQEQVLYLAKNEPKRTTEALRLLLNPHHVG